MIDPTQALKPMPLDITMHTPYGMTTLRATILVPDTESVARNKAGDREQLAAIPTETLIEELKDRVTELDF